MKTFKIRYKKLLEWQAKKKIKILKLMKSHMKVLQKAVLGKI